MKLISFSKWSAKIIKTDKFIESIVTKPKNDVIEDTDKIYKNGQSYLLQMF